MKNITKYLKCRLIHVVYNKEPATYKTSSYMNRVLGNAASPSTCDATINHSINTGEDVLSLVICINTLHVKTDGFLVFSQYFIDTVVSPFMYDNKHNSFLELI